MARGRFISKAISLDEKVDALSDDTARLLFTWLITHLDCEGRMHGDAQTVKSIVFPRRKIQVAKIEKYLKELENGELIFRYFVNGNQYLCMKNFEKHQPGLNKNRETQSQIPPPTPELIQSKSGVTPSQVKDKDKVKDKTKEEVKEESVVDGSINKESVLEVYQEEIGEPSEDMENEIDLACKRFTPVWVRDAIIEAVKRRRKDWRYIAGILKNWQRFGKDAEKNKGSPDPDKYIKGKYGHMVRRDDDFRRQKEGQ